MKALFVLATTLATSGTLLAADSSPTDVTSAAQKLAATNSYSWTTTTESAQFSPGPSHGKTEKGGFTYVDFSFNDNTTETIVKGGKGAIKGEEGWKSLEEAAKGNGEGGFDPLQMMARRMQDFKAPAAEAQDLAGKTKALAKTNDVYASDLTEEGAKSLLSFRGRRNGGEGPAVSNAKGSVKFWIKDGILTKYQYNVQGTINFNGEDRDMDRTTTTEIKDVGTTKVTVPDEAKSKMM